MEHFVEFKILQIAATEVFILNLGVLLLLNFFQFLSSKRFLWNLMMSFKFFLSALINKYHDTSFKIKWLENVSDFRVKYVCNK